MIESLKTKNEFIYAYIEWYRVDDNGIPSDKGKRVHIYDLWVHPRWQNDHASLGELIKLVKSQAKDCKSCTWQRIARGDERLRNYTRKQLFKHDRGRK